MRRCVACWGPLPKGGLLTCSPRCAKQAREAEAKRLRDAEAMHRAYDHHGEDSRQNEVETAAPTDNKSAAVGAD